MFTKRNSKYTFEGTTLLMPSPNGLGYLGQLVLDLIINTLSFKRVAIENSPFIEPLTASNIYSRDGILYTSLELYQNSDGTITILQLRSSVIKGLGIEFSSMLYEWTKLQNFDKVVILTGFDQACRNDKQLISHPSRFTGVNLKSNVEFDLESVGIHRLEPYIDEFAVHKSCIPPGAGLTRFLYDLFSSSKNELIILSWFTAEGGL